VPPPAATFTVSVSVGVALEVLLLCIVTAIIAISEAKTTNPKGNLLVNISFYTRN
jgi:hypothetical protein